MDKFDIALCSFFIRQNGDFMNTLFTDMVNGVSQEFTVEFPNFKINSSLPLQIVNFDGGTWYPAIIYSGLIDDEGGVCYIERQYGLMYFSLTDGVKSVVTDPVKYIVPTMDFFENWKELFLWCENLINNDSEVSDIFFKMVDNPSIVSQIFMNNKGDEPEKRTPSTNMGTDEYYENESGNFFRGMDDDERQDWDDLYEYVNDH